MKKGYLTVIVGGLLCASSYASAADYITQWDSAYDSTSGRTYTQFQHSYIAHQGRNSNSIKIVHQTPKKFHIELKYGIYTGTTEDTKYKRLYSGSPGLVLGQSIILNRKTYMSPGFEVDFMTGGMQYIAGTNIYRRFTKNFGAYVRYRFQYRRYARADRMRTKHGVTYRHRADTGTHRFELGLDYRLTKNWRVQYVGLYDRYIDVHNATDQNGNELKTYYYNNKRGYFYSELKTVYYGWQKTLKLVPYFELDQKAMSSTYPREDVNIKLGANYYF